MRHVVPATDAALHLDEGVTLRADIATPTGDPIGMVVFAHGSGSGRHSPRNRQVAAVLNAAGLGTVLLDLLTDQEERIDLATREYRFDIPMLGRRVVEAVDWMRERSDLPIGLFGASTGAAAALIAAAERPQTVAAVVSRGGRPDLADDALPRVEAPTLLIVGGLDYVVIDLNETAAARMSAAVSIEIVPGATHLFEEPGTLDRVAELAAGWFRTRLVEPRR